MNRKVFVFLTLTTLIAGISCTDNEQQERAVLKPVPFESLTMEGELLDRAMRNFDRLETEIFHAERFYRHDSLTDWPGDREGRIILGLVMLAQATHREPVHLEEMIRLIPEKLNEEGYRGPVQGDTID